MGGTSYHHHAYSSRWHRCLIPLIFTRFNIDENWTTGRTIYGKEWVARLILCSWRNLVFIVDDQHALCSLVGDTVCKSSEHLCQSNICLSPLLQLHSSQSLHSTSLKWFRVSMIDLNTENVNVFEYLLLVMKSVIWLIRPLNMYV